MPKKSGEQDDLLKDIYQEITPELADKVERPFLPWHKPRKHFIRIYQWAEEVRNLIKANGCQEKDVIRYLGFPGEDFLDIRTLQWVCEPLKVWLRYLGFDSTASYAGSEFHFNLTRHEVFDLGFIHDHSYVLKTRIEHLANDRSTAYQKTVQFRDFDIINIDLCNSLAGPGGGETPPYFEAIKNLCDMQIAGRTRPWLLFLATRAIRDQFDQGTKRKLFDCVVKNIRENAGFAARLREAFALDEAAIRAELSDKVQLAHSMLVSLFGVSIGKWLLGLVATAKPPLKVTLLKSYSYRVQIEEPDMLSLAFRFEPVTSPGLDSSGLTSGKARPPAKNPERQLAVELITAVCGIEDIDQKLVDDVALCEHMTDQCGDILQTAHYDKDKYCEWAASENWKPKPSAGTPA